MNFLISPAAAKVYFNVSLTILIAVLVDNILRSFVKIPKKIENRRARTYVTIFRNIITFIVYAVALHVVLVELGVNITPLLASAGVIGVIIGIGARAFIEDLIAGLFLLSQDSIAVGDYVKVDDIEGNIETIGLRTLTIRMDTGALCILPNGQVKRVLNFSRHRAQVFIDLPVKADQDITLVLKSAEEALSLLRKDKTLTSALYPGSQVNGIEDFKVTGPMLVRVTIITYPIRRIEVARKFRFLIKKEFEKNKLLFG